MTQGVAPALTLRAHLNLHTRRPGAYCKGAHMLSTSTLDTYLGKSISEICPYGYDSATDNHCAHFVAHSLQLEFGLTCAQMRGRIGGANLRVHEVFAQCSNTREILECPTTGEGLIFVSDRTNFRGTPTQISNVPRKHIGILLDGRVWHYSNTRQRVVIQTVSEFLFHYPRQSNALWYGALPMQSRLTTFGTCT